MRAPRAAAAAERAEEHVGERAVHRLAHDDRQDEARRAVERARDDQHVVVEREARWPTAARPAYEFSSEITTGMSAPPIGQHQQDADEERDARSSRRRPAGRPGLTIRYDEQSSSASRTAPMLTTFCPVGDRAPRQDLLQLAERHEAAGDGERPEQHLEAERGHDRPGDRMPVGACGCNTRRRRPASRRARRTCARSRSAAASPSSAPEHAERPADHASR